MDNYTPYTYPDSGESSPRSRGDIDFENPPTSWEDPSTLPPNYKVKFMVSYNGKIQPRSHDNLLSYIGGETKILSVERSVKFSTFLIKVNALIGPDGTDSSSCYAFKYQLPGEDLDALISVTNDDDLEHMMLEFDRMCRGSSKPARLRLFLFAVDSEKSRNSGGSAFSSVNSETGKLDRGPDREVTQNTVVSDLPEVISPPPPLPVHHNVDFLFGLEKVPVHAPGPVPVRVKDPEIVHEMNRLQISGQEIHHQQLQHQQQQSAIFPPKNDQNFADPFNKSKTPDNFPIFTPGNISVPSQFPPGHWQQVEQHQNIPLQQQPLPPPLPPQLQQHQQYQQQQQPVYMMHAPPQQSAFPAPMMNATSQGYYQVPPQQQQQMQSDQVYRDQAVYTMPSASTVAQVRSESAGYAQVVYDSATGRQVYYAAAPQGVAAPYPGMAAATAVAVSGGGDMRSSGDGKVVNKVV